MFFCQVKGYFFLSGERLVCSQANGYCFFFCYMNDHCFCQVDGHILPGGTVFCCWVHSVSFVRRTAILVRWTAICFARWTAVFRHEANGYFLSVERLFFCTWFFFFFLRRERLFFVLFWWTAVFVVRWRSTYFVYIALLYVWSVFCVFSTALLAHFDWLSFLFWGVSLLCNSPPFSGRSLVAWAHPVSRPGYCFWFWSRLGSALLYLATFYRITTLLRISTRRKHKSVGSLPRFELGTAVNFTGLFYCFFCFFLRDVEGGVPGPEPRGLCFSLYYVW